MPMKKKRGLVSGKEKMTAAKSGVDGIASILERARTNVLRAVNSQTVIAYWLIGREIVQELQGGEKRAEYGKRLIEELSIRLMERYGKGFSTTNLWYFKQFYLSFYDRSPEILHQAGGELEKKQKVHPLGGELICTGKGSPLGSRSPKGFHPDLSWSHYRTLMRVENRNARGTAARIAARKAAC